MSGEMQENSDIAVRLASEETKAGGDDHTCTMASRSLSTDGTHGVGAGNGVKGGGLLLSRSFLLFTLSTVRCRARRPRCGNQQLESRVRENRQHGSEGGEAKAFPTPYHGICVRAPYREPRFILFAALWASTIF